MKILEMIKKLEQLHQLVKDQNTGPPEEIANTLNIDTTLVYDLINRLVDMEASLGYDSTKETYLYAHGFQKQVIITISVTGANFLTKILGSNYAKHETHNFQFT